MATKFITIRIPIPSLRWFKKQKEENSYAASDDFAARILEIQTQIAALRSSLGWTEESNKTTQTSTKPVVASTTAVQEQSAVRASKEKELADIKAKLLGKKL